MTYGLCLERYARNYNNELPAQCRLLPPAIQSTQLRFPLEWQPSQTFRPPGTQPSL